MRVTDGSDKIALYEDDPMIGILLQEVFTEEHLTVLRCSTLSELQSAVDAGDVDVVVADAWGPGNGTLGNLERDQIIELGRHVPLILITGRVWAANLPQGALGTVVIVQKPMDLDHLVSEISTAIQRGRDDPIVGLARARARQLLERHRADAVAVAVLTPNREK
jgi:DNA-binding response OmpR family regulator